MPVHIDQVETVVEPPPPPRAVPASGAHPAEVADEAERHLRRVAELQERVRAD